jgi:hypothetical protein
MSARESRLAAAIAAILQQLEIMLIACPNEPIMLKLKIVLLGAPECYVAGSAENRNSLEEQISYSGSSQRQTGSMRLRSNSRRPNRLRFVPRQIEEVILVNPDD